MYYLWSNDPTKLGGGILSRELEEDNSTDNQKDSTVGSSVDKKEEQDELYSLINALMSDDDIGEDNSISEGPIDTDQKFITPDMIELPPKWFYVKVKDMVLPKGLKLTDNMKNILDMIYLQGLPKRDLTKKYKLSASSINSAFQRIRHLWAMHNAGTLNLETLDKSKKERKENQPTKSSSTTYKDMVMAAKTSTFKEIDMAIAEYLRPQIERSVQFQDVMARIGMMTTYSLMQLGILDRTQFVTLAEAVVSDPENLYRYVASNLNTLINVVDADRLRKFTKELLRIREENRILVDKVQELEDKLERHKDWLYGAGLVISKMFDYLPYKAKLEMLELLLKYEQLRQYKRGEEIAAEQAS